MGKSTINHHFQLQTVSSPEGMHSLRGASDGTNWISQLSIWCSIFRHSQNIFFSRCQSSAKIYMNYVMNYHELLWFLWRFPVNGGVPQVTMGVSILSHGYPWWLDALGPISHSEARLQRLQCQSGERRWFPPSEGGLWITCMEPIIPFLVDGLVENLQETVPFFATNL